MFISEAIPCCYSLNFLIYLLNVILELFKLATISLVIENEEVKDLNIIFLKILKFLIVINLYL